MPPVKGKGRDTARSRNSTPVSAASTEQAQGSPPLPLASPGRLTYDDILDQYCRNASPPASSVLKKIVEALKICSEIATTREETCNKGMREFSKKKRTLQELARREELAERMAEAENRERANHSAAAQAADDETRPPATGAHSVARQDGMDIDDGKPTEDVKAAGRPPQPSPTGTSTSSESHQPRPATRIPQAQIFGDDPSTAEDPTIYHIRDVSPNATDEERKEIYQVRGFPKSDLHDLTAGTPPDRDFTQAKPAQQATATQFAHYLEPYFRPLTTEDLAFLDDRGDRSGPFVIPRRGSKSYKEVWAEEDGDFSMEEKPSTEPTSFNQPRGTIDQMNDSIAESNDIAPGPLMSRLLSVLRPERRVPPGEANTNGDDANGGRDETVEPNEEPSRPLPPATSLPEASQSGWKNSSHKLEYTQVDERLKQELRYIGFLPEEAEPDYDGHNDDDVAARLRYLQEELQRVSTENGARKARIQEVATEELAKQEWSLIADDLDTQLNQAYLKRHRNIGKTKKVLKRPGGPGGAGGAGAAAGQTKVGVGEPIKALMERRGQWNELGEQVVNNGRTPVPPSSIFDEENMKRLRAKEQELWNEAQDQS